MLRKTFVIAIFLAWSASGSAYSSTFLSLYSFTGKNDGGAPLRGVTADSAGNIYGVTSSGGANGQGTIFEFTSAGKLVTLLTFTGSSNGGAPQSTLLPVVTGTTMNLYGTTSAGGGTGGHGTLFTFNPATKKLTTLHVFSSLDGATPTGALWLEPSGDVVGTTYGGGAYDLGEVYRYSPTTNTIAIIHSFKGGTSDGANPNAGITEDASGNIYGTTFFGGLDYSGTTYKISGATESILLGLKSTTTTVSVTEPALDESGNVYIAIRGGEYFGSLQLISPGGSVTGISSLGASSNLTNPDGQGLAGSPLIVKGTLYITCVGGGQNGLGTISSVKLTSGYPTTVIHSFNTIDGYSPSGKLAQTPSGIFYGTTSSGGTYGYGTIFSFTP